MYIHIYIYIRKTILYIILLTESNIAYRYTKVIWILYIKRKYSNMFIYIYIYIYIYINYSI